MGTKAKWTGLEKMQDFLKRAERKYRKPATLMRTIGEYGRSSSVKRIKEGNLGRENAPLTQAVKKGKNPLQDRGKFVQGIARKSSTDYAAWGSNDKQAAILQTGGTIKPRKAKAITIPAGPETRRLMRKYGETPRKCIAGMKAAGYQIWFPVMKDDGGVIMAQKGKRGKEFALFILRKSVTIPAYEPFRIDDNDENEIMRIVEDHLKT